MSINLTPFAELNQILEKLVSSQKEILGQNFVGIYLHGSLALGSFEPDRSDVDFMVVTSDKVSKSQEQKLAAMHANLLSSKLPFSNHLEGSYVPKAWLKEHNPPPEPRPYWNEGKFMLAPYGDEWILECYVLREHGITITGPDPRVWIASYDSKELKKAAHRILTLWWEPMLTESTRLQEAEYQTYAVLSICRILYTLEHGTIVSKPIATAWAKEHLDPTYRDLIDRTWDALPYPKIRIKKPTDSDEFARTLEFIRYAIKRSNSHDD